MLLVAPRGGGECEDHDKGVDEVSGRLSCTRKAGGVVEGECDAWGELQAMKKVKIERAHGGCPGT